jgi:hypothetical protein
MRRIENAFQDLVGQIADQQVSTIGAVEKRVINEFFALWYMRGRLRILTAQEYQAKHVTGDGLSKDQEEILESRGMMFARAGGRIPSRFLNGQELWLRTYQCARNELAGTRWGIIDSQVGEFLVPDVPSQTVIPLTPTRCLASPAPNGMVTWQSLVEINRCAIAVSHAYFFARDFRVCPVWRAPRVQPAKR